MSLLEVTDLKVAFPTEDGLVKAVQGISFSIDAGQTLGIVGESGSGKSVSTQTIMGLTRGAIIEGTALFEGCDLLTMSEPELRKVRFRSLGCWPLSGAVESDALSLEDIVAEMLGTRTSERGGRLIDKDASDSMEKKKREGYF